jgi:hypothetical protein
LQGSFLLAGFEARGTNFRLVYSDTTEGAKEAAARVAGMDRPFFVVVKASGFAFDEDDFSRLALGRYTVQRRKNRGRPFPAAAWAFAERSCGGWVIRPGRLAVRTNKSGARHAKNN